jgi:hypothetical protein
METFDPSSMVSLAIEVLAALSLFLCSFSLQDNVTRNALILNWVLSGYNGELQWNF